MNTDTNGSKTKKLLLHACCAPCSPHVSNILRRECAVSVLFYNPNIRPAAEYERRLEELNRFSREAGFELIVCDNEPEAWDAAVRGLECEPEGGARCGACFRMRLERTAREAMARGFDIFATTLSVSPHKKTTMVNEAGKEAAVSAGVVFLSEDFKKKDGFKISCEMAKELGFYRQSYCGCEYSLKR